MADDHGWQLVETPAVTDRGRTIDRLRTAAAAAVLAVACGPLLGTLWWLLAPAVTYQVLDEDVFAAPDAPNDWFGADGWFMVIGAGFGLVLGLVTFVRRGDHPVAALLGMTVGAVLAAGLARWVGTVPGPPSLEEQARGAVAGDVLHAPLEVSALGVLLVPALVAVAAYAARVLAAAVTRPTEVSPPGPELPLAQP